MVHVLQHAIISKPARSTVAEAVSKDGHVPLAGHDALKVHVHGYPELIAVAGKYRLQVRSFSSDPGDKVFDLLSLAMLGRSREHQLRPLSVDQAALEAMELVGDFVLPPAALHCGAGVSAKCPEAGLALIPGEILRDRRQEGLNLRKYARITRKLCHLSRLVLSAAGRLFCCRHKFKRYVGASIDWTASALFP